jgi:hypothetical protein
MAARVLKVTRRRVHEAYSDGASGSNGKTITDAALIATVDLDDDGRRVVQLVLKGTDHAGLISEWGTGTATTILESALDTEIAAVNEGDEIVADFLSATQKANVIRKSVAWPT